MNPPTDDAEIIPPAPEPEEEVSDELPPAAGLSRRGIVVDIISGAIGVALAIPLVGYVLEPLRARKAVGQWIKIGPIEQFQADHRVEVDYAYTRQDAWLPSTTKRRVIVASNPADERAFTVFSSTCTHLGCGVRWREERKQFLCPCHGGVFDAEGRPAGGPVFRPLDRLQSRVSDDGQLEVLEA